jgi:hypothetical protein
MCRVLDTCQYLNNLHVTSHLSDCTQVRKGSIERSSYHKQGLHRQLGESLIADVFIMPSIAKRRLIALTVGRYRDYAAVEKRKWQIDNPEQLPDVARTDRLAAALQGHRHLKGPRVLYHPDGRTMAEHHIVELLRKVARRANLKIIRTAQGSIHLNPNAMFDAIRRLEVGCPAKCGDIIVETTDR